MTDLLSPDSLLLWRAEPARFIEQVLVNPDTGKPFELLPFERRFFQHCWQRRDDGRLLYPEQLCATPKKSGKSTAAAMHVLTTTLVFGGRHAEAYVCANDLEQAVNRVFQTICRLCDASPYLRREAEVTKNKVTFPATGAVIQAIASDYAGAAGANPVISSFDELWGYTLEKSRRLWDELVPVPTRQISCRLVTTYAGFSGESELLEELYRHGLSQPQLGADLHGGDGRLMFWSHAPQAPWQDTQWLADMRRSLRPNQYLRMIENRFVTSESSFITAEAYDACVDPNQHPLIADPSLPVWVAVDASVRHDSTALVAVTFDQDRQQVRLITHKIFQPDPDHPIDFEGAVETTVMQWAASFNVKGVAYDPYQMVNSAQRLSKNGVRMIEFPQTIPNLTASSEHLYELVKGRNLCAYPDADIKLAMTRAVAIESSRGWRIGKTTQSHKIDVVVALAMASLVAVREGQKRRDLRQFHGEADGFGKLVEVGRHGGPRSRLVRLPDGTLRIAGGDNSCHRGPGINTGEFPLADDAAFFKPPPKLRPIN